MPHECQLGLSRSAGVTQKIYSTHFNNAYRVSLLKRSDLFHRWLETSFPCKIPTLIFMQETLMLEVNHINLTLGDLEQRIESLRGYL